MLDIISIMDVKLMGSDFTALAIRQRISSRYSKFPGFLIIAKIRIEGSIFLAGNHDMFNRFNTTWT